MISIEINPENVNNDNKKKIEVSEDIYSSMSECMLNICEKLSNKWENSIDEKSKDVVCDLEEYMDKYDRILYSSISNYIFGLYGDDLSSEECDEKTGNMQTNILSISRYVYGEEYQFNISQKTGKDRKISEKIPAISFKLLDHINLACQQCNSLKQTDDEYKKKFDKSIAPFKEELTKEMNAQLLTLVGIFTALSFLLFGGISSLDNIFSGINKVSILKLIIIGCIWGICLVNLVFVFLFCVSKMTKVPFSSNEDENATIFQKYPIFWWTNYLICFILCLTCIIYFISKHNLVSWLIITCRRIPGAVCCILLFVFAYIFIYAFKTLMKKCNNNDVTG